MNEKEEVKKAREAVKKNAKKFWPLMKLQPLRFALYTLIVLSLGFIGGIVFALRYF